MEPRPPRLLLGRHGARARGPRRAAARPPVRAADRAPAAERRACRVGSRTPRAGPPAGARPTTRRARAGVARAPRLAPRLLRLACAAALRRRTPAPRLPTPGRAPHIPAGRCGALVAGRARSAERRREGRLRLRRLRPDQPARPSPGPDPGQRLRLLRRALGTNRPRGPADRGRHDVVRSGGRLLRGVRVLLRESRPRRELESARALEGVRPRAAAFRYQAVAIRAGGSRLAHQQMNRGGRIRTGDLCVPNAALYQAELRPAVAGECSFAPWSSPSSRPATARRASRTRSSATRWC